MELIHFLHNILHYATLPGAAGLLCVICFMLGSRKRGQLLFLSLSFSVSVCLLLKEFFKVPRPWWPDVTTAPYLAEGGYALPCLHTMLAAALLSTLALISMHKALRLLCAAGICIIAGWRVAAGLQSIQDVLNGAAAGLLISVLLWRSCTGHQESEDGNKRSAGRQDSCAILLIFAVISGLVSAILLGNGWGLGTAVTVWILTLLEKPFRRAEAGRTSFGRIYGTIFAAGIYVGLIILLPFLIEWLVTPLWPGQTLIALLITLIPCLLRLFPIF